VAILLWTEGEVTLSKEKESGRDNKQYRNIDSTISHESEKMRKMEEESWQEMLKGE
jgi:hypothetical protein